LNAILEIPMSTRFKMFALITLLAPAGLGGCTTQEDDATTPTATTPTAPPVTEVEPPPRPTAEVRMGESPPTPAIKPTDVKPVAPASSGTTPPEIKPGDNLKLPDLNADDDASAPGASEPEPAAPPPATDERTAEFAGLRGPKPATWITHPPQSKDRLANYTVPGRDGSDAAHVVVFFFGAGQGGSKEANIARWTGQFLSSDDKPVEPKVEEFESDGLPVTLVELAGKYRNQGAGWYTDDQILLGAIVERSSGNIFIRFVGDAATVDANREAFKEMLKGLRQIEPEK
jgi:hypothetical protein